MGLNDRLQHAWNAFMNKDPTNFPKDFGVASYSYRPDRSRLTRGNERSIITSIYNRISLDTSALQIEHIKLDNNNRYIETVDSCLNNCLSLEANIDQTGRALIQDAVMSMLDEGCVAIVPIDTDMDAGIVLDPAMSSSYDIFSMRVGKIVEWRPAYVRIRVYNELTGLHEEIWFPKKMVAIVENPWYAVMNEPNSTMQRLIRKLNILDAIDEQSGAGKLDLIIQLPYVIKTEGRRQQAETRRKDIEMQLAGSKYGIAYTDGTERITQLNRSVDNNLMHQIEFLTSMLYSQLGLTQAIMDGTADDKTMNNYYTRTIEPIVSAIVDEMKRKFLTKTARTRKHSIRFFRDPFKLVPITSLPEIADKFTRNEIVTGNEMRQVIGMKPSSDPKADELRNKNINQSQNEIQGIPAGNEESENEDVDLEDDRQMTDKEYKNSLKDLDSLDSELDDLEDLLGGKELSHYASPYYDPVKAHEYYEKNKELTGHKSTARLNEAGKMAAKYVKGQLTNERKSKVETHKVSTQSQIDSVQESTKSKIESERNSMKEEVEVHKKEMQSKIDSLREMLNGLTKLQKEQKKESVYKDIAALREENNSVREKLKSEFQSTSDGLRSELSSSKRGLRDTHKEERARLGKEYEEKYINELDKIKSTSSFQRTRKRNSKKY